MVTEFGNILAHLDRAAIEAVYATEPGNELASGKFLSKESSAALAANAFGLFFAAPQRLPSLPQLDCLSWPASRVEPEAIVRFPWRGGRHPCLDVLAETSDALIGVESKRYEPFRSKATVGFSSAYWRPVWGPRMVGYQKVRDHLQDGSLRFAHLDAVQLVKHALGLRTAAKRDGRAAHLVYLYAEPEAWPDGRPIGWSQVERHRQELQYFAHSVRDDDVQFNALSYQDLLANWRSAQIPR